ncbi:hypothetical protein DVR09_15915 (plasmid) [Erythrobacter aureus]|uniref:Uncharacterized protein n=1 Tax=Erythrobacter aureus TaxID=2182384 RepID=A0A345YJ38_9SPHN|nr:hypothetical protein DVR09_15915 [Erythrobacter aureus]
MGCSLKVAQSESGAAFHPLRFIGEFITAYQVAGGLSAVGLRDLAYRGRVLGNFSEGRADLVIGEGIGREEGGVGIGVLGIDENLAAIHGHLVCRGFIHGEVVAEGLIVFGAYNVLFGGIVASGEG